MAQRKETYLSVFLVWHSIPVDIMTTLVIRSIVEPTWSRGDLDQLINLSSVTTHQRKRGSIICSSNFTKIDSKAITKKSHFWEQIYIKNAWTQLFSLYQFFLYRKPAKSPGRMSLKQTDLGFDFHLGIKF